MLNSVTAAVKSKHSKDENEIERLIIRRADARVMQTRVKSPTPASSAVQSFSQIHKTTA